MTTEPKDAITEAIVDLLRSTELVDERRVHVSGVKIRVAYETDPDPMNGQTERFATLYIGLAECGGFIRQALDGPEAPGERYLRP